MPGRVLIGPRGLCWRTVTAVALAVCACSEPVEPTRVEGVAPAELRALAGAPGEVEVSISGDCWKRRAGDALPTVELASGEALPAAVRTLVLKRYEAGTYFIGNPGSGSPFDLPPPPPAACPGWTYPGVDTNAFTPHSVDGGCPGVVGFRIRIVAEPSAPPGSIALRLRIPACGEVVHASFTLDLVGAMPAPGVCALSSGEPCETDADCTAQGCYDAGARCGAIPGTGPANPSCSGDMLPGPLGVTCGCTAGICAWH